MTISKLIAYLEKAKEELGDIRVVCERSAGYGEPYTDFETTPKIGGSKELVI